MFSFGGGSGSGGGGGPVCESVFCSFLINFLFIFPPLHKFRIPTFGLT